MTRVTKPDTDLLLELAQVGADQAAEAFGQLLGLSVEVGGARVVPVAEVQVASDPQSTGVFFELEGCLDATVALLFPGVASEALVRRIVGLEDGALEPTIVESALMEIGNILASHVASAIADRLGERLLPSIPSLAMGDAPAELATFLARRVPEDAPQVEMPLGCETGPIRATLVLTPTR